MVLCLDTSFLQRHINGLHGAIASCQWVDTRGLKVADAQNLGHVRPGQSCEDPKARRAPCRTPSLLEHPSPLLVPPRRLGRLILHQPPPTRRRPSRIPLRPRMMISHNSTRLREARLVDGRRMISRPERVRRPASIFRPPSLHKAFLPLAEMM
jgi:hypothetical protein